MTELRNGEGLSLVTSAATKGLRYVLILWQSNGTGGSDSMITGLIIQMVVILLPVCALLGAALLHRANRERKKIRRPVSEKLLRPPGETLRRKLEELDERLFLFSSMLLTSTSVAGVMANQELAHSRSIEAVAYHPGVLLLIFISFYSIWKMFRLLKRRIAFLLGLSGELAVGEELNKLMLDGCRVFHDFPGGDDWNIDHIIVAPGGVFAVETKARSKRALLKDQPDHKVEYNGEILIFPDGWTAKPLNQAERNALQLAIFLKKATGEESPVIPVVVLPGWYVTAKPNTRTKVFNPKMVRKLVVESRPVISAAQMQRICFQIEQKCRDVEF